VANYHAKIINTGLELALATIKMFYSSLHKN